MGDAPCWDVGDTLWWLVWIVPVVAAGWEGRTVFHPGFVLTKDV